MEGLSRGQVVYMGRLGSEAISILGLLWNLHGDVHTSMECLHGSMLFDMGVIYTRKIHTYMHTYMHT